MTGADLRAIRKRLGIRAADFALCLGYGGETDVTRSRQLYALEQGRRPIPDRVALLALAYDALARIPESISMRVFASPPRSRPRHMSRPSSPRRPTATGGSRPSA